MTLAASARQEQGRKTFALRQADRIPGVIYGAGGDPLMVSVEYNPFAKVFKAAGESSLVDLNVDGSVHKVLVQDVQADPLTNRYIHVDFRRVDLTKPVEAEVKLRFVGESSAVKNLSGVLVHAREHLKIRALPTKLVPSLDVDISKLATFEDTFHVSDLQLPEGVEVMEETSLTLAIVAPPRSEEELASLDQAVTADVSQVEMVEKKKKEDEEGAEGEAAAADAGDKKSEKKEEKK